MREGGREGQKNEEAREAKEGEEGEREGGREGGAHLAGVPVFDLDVNVAPVLVGGVGGREEEGFGDLRKGGGEGGSEGGGREGGQAKGG